MARRRKRPPEWNVPDGPVGLDEALGRFPAVRQSLLANFDDCHLSTLFDTRYAKGWSTNPQASGQLFHRFAAKCLIEMKLRDSEHIPVAAALGILEEVLDQDDVEPRDIVALPLREIPLLEMAAKKFATDNAFTVRNILAVERRLWATLRYQAEDGTWVDRKLTGQLDALIAQSPTEAAVIDWKRTWKLPPERHEDSEQPGISYHGYFQQFFYAWLVMMNFSEIQAVTLREFYVFRTRTRRARVTRGDLPAIEKKLGRLVRQFDKSVMAGAPPTLTIEDIEQHGFWKPAPGAHCFFCAAARLCPLAEDEPGAEPSIRTEEDAQRLAGERQVAKAILKRNKEVLEAYADAKGPIPLKDAKGRRVLGHRPIAGGKTRFEEYTPDDSDRPPTKGSQNPNLVEAMRRATARAKEARRS